MRHHLGEFRPAPDLIGPVLRAMGDACEPSPARELLPRLVRLLAQGEPSPECLLEELLAGSDERGDGFFGAGPRRLRVALREELRELREAPDLLASEALEPEDRAWTRALYEELARCGPRRAGLRLVECAWRAGPDGYVAVAGVNFQAAQELRPGDPVHGGFVALRRAGGALLVHARVHRAACANGLVLSEPGGEDELEREGSIGAAVAHCLSAAVVEKHARRLRAAARTPVAERAELLARLGEPELARRVELEWRASEDPSLFGAADALASVARGERDFARRVELERRGGALLERAALYPAG